MSAETFWAITGAGILILIAVLGYFLKTDKERIRKEIDDIRGRFHTINNLLTGAIQRTEFQDAIKSIRDDLRDIEHRVDRLFNREK